MLSGWTLAAVVLAAALPEASYVAFWPALSGWLALAGLLAWETKTADRILPASARLLAAVPVFACVILSAPLLALGWTALPVALPLLAAWVAFVAWNILMLTEEILPGRRWKY